MSFICAFIKFRCNYRNLHVFILQKGLFLGCNMRIICKLMNLAQMSRDWHHCRKCRWSQDIERLGWILTVHSLYQKASWPSYDWSIKPTLLWILILSNSLLDGERTFNLILMISLIKPDHFIAFTSLVRKKKMCTNIQEWTIDIRTTVHTKEAAVDDHLVPKTQTLQFA